MNPLFMAILQNIVVPEISKFIQDHFNATGELPSEQELRDKVGSLADHIIAGGEALIEKIKSENPDSGIV